VDRQVTISVTVGRRGIRAIIGALLVVALAIPATVIASHDFSDVPNSNTFHQDISDIKTRGITTGCGSGIYCPADNVTREQMAGFINRVFRAEGTVMAYATVDANGTVRESYTRNFGAVSVAAHNLTGFYSVTLGGLTIRPDQAITVTPRETFGIEQCNVFQGNSNKTTVDVFCHNAEPGSPAADVAFTLVVYN
jgi:hypothetical protein